jgi:hypothetical protein
VAVYEIVVIRYVPRDEQSRERFDNPVDTDIRFRKLSEELGELGSLTAIKNGKEISGAQLSREGACYVPSDPYSNIEEVRESETRLPSTFRPAWNGGDDISIGADGQVHGVDRPKNPEDRFED